MSRTAVACGLGLAVGVGIGFLVGSAGTGSAPALLTGGGGGEAADAPGGPPVAAAASAPASAPAAAPATATGSGGASSVGAGGGSLAAALAGLPAPETVTGTGAIDGTVATADGTPVPGVRVRVNNTTRAMRASMRHWRRGGAGPPIAPDLETAAREAAAEWRRSRAEDREAVTGPEGRFRIEGLVPESSYGIGAWLEGWEVVAGDFMRMQRVRVGETVDFVATRLVAVPVTVLLPDGTEPAQATLRIREEARAAMGRVRWPQGPWTPEDRALLLEPGVHRVRAEVGDEEAWNPTAESAADLASDEQEIRVAADGAPAPVTFRVVGRPGIRGRIVVPRGVDVQMGQVYILRVEPGSARDAERVKREGRSTWYMSARAQYAFPDLAAGTYLVGASRSREGPVVVVEAVEVADRMVARDLTLPGAEAAGGLIVRVLGPDGAPLPDVTFNFSGRGPRMPWGNESGATRRKDGSWRVDPPDAVGRAPRGGAADVSKVSLEVHSVSHGTQTVEVPPGAAELVVRFGEPAWVDVTVAGYARSGHEGHVGVFLVAAGTEGEAAERQALWMQRRFAMAGQDAPRLSAEGKQRLGPVAPGAYDVVCQVAIGGEGMGTDELEAARTRVTLARGTNAATLRLPGLHTVTITVPKVDGEAQVALTPGEDADLGMGSVHRAVDPAGKVVFARVPAGTYRLMLWGGDTHGEMTIRVPEQCDVQFAAQEMTAMRVSIGDPKGALAAAGLEDGDLVVGAHGTEFTSMEDLRRAWAAAPGGTTVRLTVERAGRRFEATLEVASLNGEAAGGHLRPTTR